MNIDNDNDDDCDLVEQGERYGVSERPLQDAVVLPCYHLLVIDNDGQVDAGDDEEEEEEDLDVERDVAAFSGTVPVEEETCLRMRMVRSRNDEEETAKEDDGGESQVDASGGGSVIGWSWWGEVGKDKAKEDLIRYENMR